MRNFGKISNLSYPTTFESDLKNTIREELARVENYKKCKIISEGDFTEEEIKKLEKEYGCQIKRSSKGK